jgi:hypothetical protein
MIYVKFGNFVKFQINYTSLARLQISLKAKLYILKNHTLLLLGPSSFEHWFKSYQIITVGSLHFCDIAFGSSFVYLSLPLLYFLCPHAAAAALPTMCAASAASAPLYAVHMPFPAPWPPSPTSRWPPPTTLLFYVSRATGL